MDNMSATGAHCAGGSVANVHVSLDDVVNKQRDSFDAMALDIADAIQTIQAACGEELAKTAAVHHSNNFQQANQYLHPEVSAGAAGFPSTVTGGPPPAPMRISRTPSLPIPVASGAAATAAAAAAAAAAASLDSTSSSHVRGSSLARSQSQSGGRLATSRTRHGSTSSLSASWGGGSRSRLGSSGSVSLGASFRERAGSGKASTAALAEKRRRLTSTSSLPETAVGRGPRRERGWSLSGINLAEMLTDSLAGQHLSSSLPNGGHGLLHGRHAFTLADLAHLAQSGAARATRRSSLRPSRRRASILIHDNEELLRGLVNSLETLVANTRDLSSAHSQSSKGSRSSRHRAIAAAAAPRPLAS